MLAGTTPAPAHNSACDPLFEGEGFLHVLYEHVPGGPGTSGDALFLTYLDGEEAVDGTADLITDPVRSTQGLPSWPDENGNPGDGTVHTYDFNSPMGCKLVNGEEVFTSVVEVILNPDGSIRTAHPLDPTKIP
ncbi:hypothetical protein SUDANB6_00058 [Streptomyces sp. enrichment culture]|uniref:hypothetical protein n=1 Tax=Streptomyces sp. enrichment culture TaxID=1795815 RepID=UPI003F55DDC5